MKSVRSIAEDTLKRLFHVGKKKSDGNKKVSVEFRILDEQFIGMNREVCDEYFNDLDTESFWQSEYYVWGLEMGLIKLCIPSVYDDEPKNNILEAMKITNELRKKKGTPSYVIFSTRTENDQEVSFDITVYPIHQNDRNEISKHKDRQKMSDEEVEAILYSIRNLSNSNERTARALLARAGFNLKDCVVFPVDCDEDSGETILYSDSISVLFEGRRISI